MEKKEVTKKESGLDDSVDLSPMTEQLDKTSEINVDYNSFKLPILARDGEPVYKPLTFKEQIYLKTDGTMWANINGVWYQIGGYTAIGKMYKAGAQTISSGTTATISLDTKEIEVGLTVNTSTNRIVITSAGYYSIIGSVGWGSSTADAIHNTVISVNTTAVASNFLHSTSDSKYITPMTSTIKYLDVDDYVQLKGGHSSGTNKDTLGGDSIYTFLCVNKL